MADYWVASVATIWLHMYSSLGLAVSIVHHSTLADFDSEQIQKKTNVLSLYNFFPAEVTDHLVSSGVHVFSSEIGDNVSGVTAQIVDKFGREVSCQNVLPVSSFNISALKQRRRISF